MGEVFPIHAEMTQRQLHQQHSVWVTVHKAGNLENTAQVAEIILFRHIDCLAWLISGSLYF